MRTMILTMHSTMSGIFGQMDEQSTNSSAMGRAFDTAKDDDSFYLGRTFSRTKTSGESWTFSYLPTGKPPVCSLAKRRSRDARGYFAGRSD